MTLQNDFEDLIDSIETNLTTMGVSDAEFDSTTGIKGLLTKILDIEGSVGGLTISTDLTCTPSSNTAYFNVPFVINGKLNASYDDTTQTNEDFSGFIQHGAVKIYDGETLLGTTTTDDNGEYSFSISFDSIGTHSIKSVFDGTRYYTHSVSTINNINVVYPALTLTSTKNTLSYYDEESTTISSSNFPSNIPNGSTVSISVRDKFNDEILSDTVTVSNNNFTYTYSSQGVGDVTVNVNCLDMVSGSINIEDCIYYNPTEVSRTATNGSTIYDDDMSITLPVNCTITMDYYSNNTQSGEHRFFMLPKSYWNSGTTQPTYALYIDHYSTSKVNIGNRNNGSTQSFITLSNITGSTYHTLKYVKTGTSIAVYIDDDLKTTQTISWINNYSDYCLSMMRWNARGTSKIKNVKIKSEPIIDLTASKKEC